MCPPLDQISGSQPFSSDVPPQTRHKDSRAPSSTPLMIKYAQFHHFKPDFVIIRNYIKEWILFQCLLLNQLNCQCLGQRYSTISLSYIFSTYPLPPASVDLLCLANNSNS